MQVHGVLPQLEKFSSDHFGGTIDCVLRLGLPCYQDQNQADGITPQGTHNFSNMNNGRSYSTQAMKENEMQIGKENADVTFYDYANHRPWSPSTTTRVVQSNNENICGYVEVPPIEIPSGFNCFGSPSFHSDSLNLQKPVIPTRGRSKRKYMKKASDSKCCCNTCGRKKTPLWRKGPDGPQTLCNACGLRYSRAMKRAEKALGLQFNLNLATQEELGDEALEDLLF